MSDRKPRSDSTPGTKRRRRAITATADGTRAQVIRAAIETVQLEGYYRSSSNAIARRAGVSWGVIQHYFRTREALLGAVVEQTLADEIAVLEAAEVTGSTVEERLMSFARAQFSFFRRPEYLASLEILTNLAREPATRAPTLQALRGYVARKSEITAARLGQVSPQLAASTDLRTLVVYAVGGLAISQDVGELLYHDSGVDERAFDEAEQLTLVVRALATLFGRS